MELIEIPLEEYQKNFTKEPHLFISIKYLKINFCKTDSLICLTPEDKKYKIGIIAGINKKIIKSPFSAPFGGFHFNKSRIYYSYINNFIIALKKYIIRHYRGIDILMPPDYYHYSINTKFIHAMICADFTLGAPEINNWINLNDYNGNYPDSQIKRNLTKSKNSLNFFYISAITEQEKCFEIIVNNRKQLNRSIHMDFNNIIEMSQIVPIDYFLIKEKKNMIASAIIYRMNNNIVKIIFWGDSARGRVLHAMDFLIDKLWEYYMNEGYAIIDVGTSTDAGVPNDGLIRFKENHGCHSSPQFHLNWRK